MRFYSLVSCWSPDRSCGQQRAAGCHFPGESHGLAFSVEGSSPSLALRITHSVWSLWMEHAQYRGMCRSATSFCTCHLRTSCSTLRSFLSARTLSVAVEHTRVHVNRCFCIVLYFSFVSDAEAQPSGLMCAARQRLSCRASPLWSCIQDNKAALDQMHIISVFRIPLKVINAEPMCSGETKSRWWVFKKRKRPVSHLAYLPLAGASCVQVPCRARWSPAQGGPGVGLLVAWKTRGLFLRGRELGLAGLGGGCG